MPNSPKPLLGRDLLEKLEAEVKFKKGKGVQVIIPQSKFFGVATFFTQDRCGEIPIEVENGVNTIVWASDVPGRFKQAEPVCTQTRSHTGKAKTVPFEIIKSEKIGTYN